MRIAAAIRIDRPTTGPRVYVVGRRVHHGTAGAVALFAALILRSPTVGAIGLAALIHDRQDFPFTDNHNH